MAAPDWVPPAVKLASSWVFPAVSLSSLAAHLFLVFFSGIRRRQASGVPRVLLWLAYQVNNWAPIYVLGNLYFDTEPHEKQLYAFWVPFLLLHLARPDNISAYSMEDNALAGRVMLFVPLQSVGAFTVIYRYIHVDSTAGTLRPASWIMFSLAIFKYVESVMALRRGGLDNIRSSFKPTKSSKTGHGGGSDEGDSEEGEEDPEESEDDSEEENVMEVEKDLLVAHYLLDICKCAFTDYSVKMDIRKQQRVRKFGWKKMPKVVEMELSLMYDILYTKAAMVHTWGGYGIRVVSPFLTATAFSLFLSRYRDQGLNSRDVDISYILLGTTLVLDVTWLLRAIGWAHAFFNGTRRWHWVQCAVISRGRWKWIRRLVVSLDTSRLSISGCELLRDKKPSSYRAWSGMVGQHNLLRDFRDTERCSSKLAKSIGLEQSWNAHCYSGPGRALDFSRDVDIRENLFQQIWLLVLVAAPEPKPKEEEAGMQPAAMVPQRSYLTRKKLDLALGFDPEIEEVVLIWHIATGVFLSCAQEDCPGEEWSTETEKVIRAVSDYMLFIIAVRPGMIPGLKFRSLYEDTRNDLNTLWVDDRCASRCTAGVDEEKLARILRSKVDTLRKVDILSQGTRCALMMLRRVNRSISCSKIPESDLPVLKKLNGLHQELFRVELDVAKMCEELDMTKICKELATMTNMCEELDMTMMSKESCMAMMCEELDKLDDIYKKLDMRTMLDVIFDVWVRLLIYVSIRCSRDSHAKQLGLGVELTTIIWILTQHTGIMSPTRSRGLINGTNAAASQAALIEFLIYHLGLSQFRKSN